MKVFLHYEDNESKLLHKSLKITLPKKWKTGPTSKLLEFAVESYNASDLGTSNPLNALQIYLAIKVTPEEGAQSQVESSEGILTPLASDAVIIEVIGDRDDVYIVHGTSQTVQDIQQEKQAESDRKKEELAKSLACVHFGCKNRWAKGTPPPDCSHHAAPPVFHETAKFWSCCPQKKAYDWEDFQAIPGCQTGKCTNVKEENAGPQFLGGCDLRDAIGEAQKLKSIDDFNSAQAAGGSDSAPVVERLRSVMGEIGVENELFDQVFEGIKRDVGAGGADGGDELGEATAELGEKLKKAMKAIAVDQLRMK
jgi:hypothetical protein